MGLFDFLRKSEKTEEEVTMSFDEPTTEGRLEKGVKPTPNTDFLDGKVDVNKAVFSLDSKAPGIDRLYHKQGRLQDKDLKDICSYDAIIGLIVNTRANQALSFGKRSTGKYDRGFILQEKVSVQENPHLSSEEKNKETQYRMELANKISEYVTNCGTSNRMVKDKVFKNSDSYFKDCTLQEFISAQVLNLLIFGRAATQIIRNKDGVPIMFRPLAVETLKRVIDQADITLDEGEDTHEQSVKDSAEYRKIEKGRRPVAYVQRMEGKNVAFFTEEEVKMTYLRKQAFEDLDGYPLSPIEQAYFTVSMHFYAQQYQQNAFTRGLASKGIINLKTKEGGVISPDQVETFRKLFTNYVARNDNSATIPVISGPIEAEFIELNATAKDMEFTKLYQNVVTIMCACFQISPQEIGFDSMSSAGPSLGDGNKQEQIVQGEERGLRQLIESIFALLDNIIYEVFPESKKLFRFHPIGLGQNTKEADLALYKEELQTSGTFGKIWADSERIESFPFGGNVPTSPLFHASVVPYMKMSELRYHFFGEEGALDNPDYDFFLDVAKNEMYMSAKFKSQEMQAEQMGMQLEQMKLQLALQQQQTKTQLAMSEQQPQEGEEGAQEAPEGEGAPEQEQAAQEAEMAAEKHRIEVEEAQQNLQQNQEKHKAEMLKLEAEIAEKKKDQKKSVGVLKDIIDSRPKSLKDHYKKK